MASEIEEMDAGAKAALGKPDAEYFGLVIKNINDPWSFGSLGFRIPALWRDSGKTGGEIGAWVRLRIAEAEDAYLREYGSLTDGMKLIDPAAPVTPENMTTDFAPKESDEERRKRTWHEIFENSRSAAPIDFKKFLGSEPKADEV